MMRTFEYRLYPNKQQTHQLMQCLQASRHLYNEMLEAVKTQYEDKAEMKPYDVIIDYMLEALKTQYEDKGTFPTKYDLTAQFKGRGGKQVPATTVQTLADRLSKALKRFLASKELAMNVGFPRFKSANRWHSIHLRQYGLSRDVWLDEDGKHLHVPAKLGKSLKIKLHRPLEGIPKTAHLVLRADNHWYALIVCQAEPQTEHFLSTCSHPDIGIDVGLKSFLTDSDGHTVENPRYYRTSQKTLRRKQRALCRRKKGSHRRRKAAKNVAKTHLKIARERRDFHFKTAKQYTQRYHHIAVEDLAKSIMDASWGAFLDILEAKAESAGHQVIRVKPHYTTQKCNNCGELVQKSLSVRTHICTSCGSVADRDVNAAKNIWERPGYGLQGRSPLGVRSN